MIYEYALTTFNMPIDNQELRDTSIGCPLTQTSSVIRGEAMQLYVTRLDQIVEEARAAEDAASEACNKYHGGDTWALFDSWGDRDFANDRAHMLHMGRDEQVARLRENGCLQK